MTQVARQDDEAAALVRLGFDELHGFAPSVGTMERDIAARAFRYVPMGKRIRFVHDAMNDGVVGALGGHSMGGLVSRSACHLAAKDGSATVTRSPRHPVGRVVRDTLVLKPSASGRSRTRKLGFEDEYGLHLAATNHIALLNHPGVYEKLWEWLR